MIEKGRRYATCLRSLSYRLSLRFFGWSSETKETGLECDLIHHASGVLFSSTGHAARLARRVKSGTPCSDFKLPFTRTVRESPSTLSGTQTRSEGTSDGEAFSGLFRPEFPPRAVYIIDSERWIRVFSGALQTSRSGTLQRRSEAHLACSSQWDHTRPPVHR